ncbi:MAG: protein translocase subunit SecF [Deltaproteobacteria bacterium]|nr:protein translocase subunit SecF [Deltaproteobacteria bacterium]
MDIWGDTNIDFLGKRRIAFFLSGIFSVIGLIAILAIPLGKANLGTDFSGGVAVQFRFEKPVETEKVRDLLEVAGIKDAILQEFADSTKLLIKIKKGERDLRGVSTSLSEVLAKGLADNPFTIDQTIEIGPTVGKKLQKDALWAIFISLAGILMYIAWRFEFRFGVAAAVATFHDVLVVLAALLLMNKEINLLIVTALLTIAGYSLTDTVVVFDRIRENLRKKREGESLEGLMNRSVNEVLRRTIVTAGTTLLVLIAMLIMGGEVIHDFSLTLFLGVIVGTYSSIFVASPLMLLWKGKGKLIRE